MVHLRAFKAIEDEQACLSFSNGHMKVLADYGVTKVTSAKNDWMYNPDVYVVIASLPETSEVVGGVRVHVAGSSGIPLPFETAVAQVDTRVYDLVDKHRMAGTAELCGLWNARAVAGRGLGIKYMMWAGIALSHNIGLKTLFALAAEHTLPISIDKGFVLETSIGNNGGFVYPKLDLVATSIVIPDLKTLEFAKHDERQRIIRLREAKYERVIENTQKGPWEVIYDLRMATKPPAH